MDTSWPLRILISHPQHTRHSDVSRKALPQLAASHDPEADCRRLLEPLSSLASQTHVRPFDVGSRVRLGRPNRLWRVVHLPWARSLSCPWPLTSPDFNADHLQQPLAQSILLQFCHFLFPLKSGQIPFGRRFLDEHQALHPSPGPTVLNGKACPGQAVNAGAK